MYKQYIGGQLVEGQGRPMHIANPATGEIIATFEGATAQQATEALDAADAAFKTWSKTPLNERANWLLKLREACLAERDKFI